MFNVGFRNVNPAGVSFRKKDETPPSRPLAGLIAPPAPPKPKKPTEKSPTGFPPLAGLIAPPTPKKPSEKFPMGYPPLAGLISPPPKAPSIPIPKLPDEKVDQPKVKNED